MLINLKWKSGQQKPFDTAIKMGENIFDVEISETKPIEIWEKNA